MSIYYPGVGNVDAVIDIVKGKYDVPQDSGVPSGDVFVYSDYNQAGSTVLDSSPKSPNINVGDGTMLKGVLQQNGQIVSNGFNSIKEELIKSTQKQVDQLLSYERTFDTVLGKINTSISTSGISVSSANSNLANAINSQTSKQSEQNNTLKDLVKVQKDAGEKQIEYHEERLEEINFNKNGTTALKDTQGNVIKPREARAVKDAEIAQEESRMNKVNHGEILDKLANDTEEQNLATNLIEEVLSFYKDVDVNNLDNLITNDEEFKNV